MIVYEEDEAGFDPEVYGKMSPDELVLALRELAGQVKFREEVARRATQALNEAKDRLAAAKQVAWRYAEENGGECVCDTGVLRLQQNSQPAVVIENEGLIPEQYWRVTRALSLTDVARAIKAQALPEGAARLEFGHHVRFK